MRKKIILILVSLFMIISSTLYVSADDTNDTVNHGSTLTVSRDSETESIKTNNTHRITIDATNANANQKDSKPMRVYLHDPSGKPLTNIEIDGMEEGIMYFPYDDPTINEPIELKDVVVKDANGNVTERYLEFDIIAGASVEMELELFVPGGISGNTDLKITPEIENPKPNDIVGEPVEVEWTAEFKWTNLTKSVDTTSYARGDDPVLNYTYDVTNKPGIEGNIWEKEIKVVDTLTLPDGLTLPEGYIIDTKNNKITTSAGDDIYSFDFGLKYNPTAADSRNITVSNDRKTITITGVYENPHLDHNDVLENDSNPLKQWHSQLHTDKLVKTNDVTGKIDNKIDATFVPCVNVDEIPLHNDAETTITDPPATPEPAKNTLTINKYDNYTNHLIDMYKNGITITYEITGLTGLTFKKPANATVTVNDDGTVVILPSDSTSERVVLEAADSNTPASEQFTIPASNKFVTNAPAIVFSQVLESILNNVTIKEFQAPEGYVIPNYYKNKAFKPSKYYSGYYFSFNDDRVAPSPDDNPNQNTIGLYKISGSGNNEILDYEPTNPIQPKELILDVYYGTGESDGMRVKFYHTSNNTFVYDGFFEPGDWGHSIHFTDVNASLIQMKNLPDGEYIVKEYQAPHGYELTYERMSIKVEDGKVYLKPDASNSTEWTEVNYTDGYPDKYLGLKNKRIPTELRIYKVDDNLNAIDEIDESNPVTYSLLNAKGESMLLLKNKKDGKYYYAGVYKEGVLTPITEENPFYPYQPHEDGPYLFEDNKKITRGYLYDPVGGKIEMPCTIYFYASAANREQTPGGPIPQPYALQYQMNCYVPGPNGYHEWTGWIDSKTPTNLLMNKNGGNQATFEYEVTQDILDANGGVAGNDISVRAKKFPNAPIEQLKQTVKFGYPKVVNLGEDYEIINSSSIVATSSMITIYGLPTTNDYLNGDEYILTEVKAPEGYDKTNEKYLIEIRDSSTYHYRSNYTSEYIENHKTGTEYPEETNHYLYIGKVSGLENGLIGSALFNAALGSPKVNPKGLEIVVRDQTDIQNVKQLILADHVSSIGGVSTETFEYIGVYDDTDNPNSVHPVTVSGNYNLRLKNLPCPSGADTANYFEYSIEEIRAPKGYKINPEKLIFRVYKNYLKFTVVKEGNELTTEVVLPEPTVIDAVTNVSGKKTEYYFNSHYMVINDEEANDPSMVFIEKQDENGKLINDSQTKFILKDSNGDVVTFSDIVHDSADGNIYNLDANSNEAILSANDNGKIAIKNLPKGQYTLVEVEAPHGYTLISTPITITVSGMGDDIKVVVKDPSIGFGSERFASTSYKKIEEIDNSDNAGYSFYVNNEENVQGLKNYITVDDASKNVRYSLFVTNQSKNNFENLVIIDKLPEPDDTGVINLDEYRGSQFTIRLLDEPNFKVYEYDENGIKVNEITNFTVEFSDNTSFTEADFNGVEDSSRWSLVDDLSRSFRIKFADSFKLYTKHTIGVEFDAKMMSDAAPGKIAWNNFGYRYKVGSKILTPEPLKVGVRIKSNNPGNPPKYEAPNTKVN